MPYLAWRIPFLSTQNFNANTLRWPTYSSSCFDIILHFLCECWFIISRWITKEICLHHCTLLCSQLADCSVVRLNIVWYRCFCRVSGHQQTWKRERESWSPGPGWVGEEGRVELGGSCEAPSPDPRSGAGIKVACFMWLVWDFEVSESPTALTSSSSLVS